MTASFMVRELEDATSRSRLPWRVTPGLATVRGWFNGHRYLIVVREEIAANGWSWTLQRDIEVVATSSVPLNAVVDAVNAGEDAYYRDLRVRRRRNQPT